LSGTFLGSKVFLTGKVYAMENKFEKLHKAIIKLPSILEKIVAAILIISVVFGCCRLLIQAFNFDMEFSHYSEEILATAFNVIIIVEFIRMLVKHSMNTIVEVLIFAIARTLVVGHDDAIMALISIVAIAVLMACRKFLFKKFDFEEEK